MADEALTALTDLLESVPGWINELESILQASTERQKEILFENQHGGEPRQLIRKASKSSSLLSKPSKDGKREDDAGAPVEEEEPKDDEALARPQLPHMTQSDALRLAQRKRKTASALSDLSGRPRFRSRAMIVVYYDGDTQKQFESLVRAIGGSRNALRKGKMSARVDALSRTGSGSSSEASSSEDQVATTPKLNFRSTRAIRVATATSSKDSTTETFDKLDLLLEKAQALCEKAAHQVLRDGDCALEMRFAKEHVVDLQKVGEDELPVLEKRAEKSIARQKRERDREKSAAEEADAQKKHAPREQVSEKLENPFTSPGSLEVDLEADDSDEGEDMDFEVGAVQLGKFGIRSTRVPPVRAT